MHEGHLRSQTLSAVVHTECGHCHTPLQIELDSDLNLQLDLQAPEPFVYSPLLDIQKLEPSIIEGF